jgi:hypothetical protein
MADEEAKETTQEEGSNDESENAAETGGRDTDSGGSLRDYIAEVVREIVGSGDGGSAAGDNSERSPRRTQAAQESSIAALVREEQAKLMKEQEREAEHRKLSEEVAALKKVTERPPARAGIGGKIQRFMWGES